MKRKVDYKLLFFCILLISLIVYILVIFLSSKSNLSKSILQTNSNPISMNYNSGFYDKSLYLKITLNKSLPTNTNIYYTLNGDDPTNESDIYVDGINLELKDDILLYPLKVLLCSNDNCSDIYNYTYVLGNDILNSLDLDVYSLTTDNDNLYDKENGLFIEKNLKKTNPQLIKESNLSIYSSKGDELANQGVGIKLSGNASLSYDIKSFKVYFSNGFDKEKDRLKLDLYSKDVSKYSISSSYNSLILRGGSQDTNVTNIKSSLMNNLLSDTSLVSGSHRMLFFLNGKFQGVYDVINSMNEDTIASMYDINDKETITVYDSGEEKVFDDANISNLFKNDLSVSSNRSLLERSLDIDSYLKYYAVSIITNNRDVFLRNFKAFRYTGEEGTLLKSNVLYVLPYDFDDSFNNGRKVAGTNDINDSIDLIFGQEGFGTNFRILMKQDYYRNKFMNMLVNLLDTTLSEDNILKNIDNEYSKIDKSYSLLYSLEAKNNIISNIDYVKNQVKTRNKNIIKRVTDYLNINNSYNISISTDDGSYVKLGDILIEANSSYSTKYYGDFTLFKFDAYKGYELDSITINDYTLPLVNSAKEFEINKNYLEYYKNDIKIQLHSKKSEETIIIDEISASGDSDWYKLTNVSSNDINLSNYYLSDTSNNFFKYKLPDVVLKSGKSIVINGSKNYYAIRDYISNFSLNSKETLYLYDSNKLNVIDKLDVPKMGDNESYGRYKLTNEYRFFKNYSNIRKNK